MENASFSTENIPHLTQRTAKNPSRSRVGNGAKLLPLTDGRSASARRFKDLIQDIGADLGGLEYLSEGQRQLIRRASLLSAESERQEALWARGEAEFDIDQYTVLTNALRRIGLRRVRDAVTLEKYIDGEVGAPAPANQPEEKSEDSS